MMFKNNIVEKRNSNIDVIRSVAVFFVISVHFFLNNGFYEEIVLGKRMYIMILMRTLFMACVPLFMLLTGYLMCNKTLDIKYYKGIIRTLEVYCIASVLIILFQRYYFKEEQGVKKVYCLYWE